MPVTYIIVDTLITNDEEIEKYKLLAKPFVERFGGDYLAREGQLVVKEKQLRSPTRLVLLRFPFGDVRGFIKSHFFSLG
jgi:uncharacterized protein (DUF1330 family)